MDLLQSTQNDLLRSLAMEALARLIFGHPVLARSLLETCGLLDVLRVVFRDGSMPERLTALQLVQALAAGGALEKQAEAVMQEAKWFFKDGPPNRGLEASDATFSHLFSMWCLFMWFLDRVWLPTAAFGPAFEEFKDNAWAQLHEAALDIFVSMSFSHPEQVRLGAAGPLPTTIASYEKLLHYLH